MFGYKSLKPVIWLLVITFGTFPDIILQYLAVDKVESRYKVSISLKPVNICRPTTPLIRFPERPCFSREKFQSLDFFSIEISKNL